MQSEIETGSINIYLQNIFTECQSEAWIFCREESISIHSVFDFSGQCWIGLYVSAAFCVLP